MAFHNTNWMAITLSGSQGSSIHGDGTGFSSSTTHRIYCLTTGTITITPVGGNQFTWSGTTNTSFDISTIATTVNSGAFLAIKSKHTPSQFFNPSYPQTDIGGS
jgi:hypothetical protein